MRIEDEIGKLDADVLSRAPAEILPGFDRWLTFCDALALGDLPPFELLTIDLNFIKDPTSPRFPPMENTWEVDPDYDNDPFLHRLGWSQRLRGSGKNTGLVIAATTVGMSVSRNLPIGTAVHTGYPDMAARDVTSALLLAQIMLASGERLQKGSSRDLLRHVIKMVQACPPTCQTALPAAAIRFREALLTRACSDGKGPTVWVDTDSIVRLQGAMSAATQCELDDRLDQCGLQLFDRDGRADCLSLSSIFVDKLAEWNPDRMVVSFRNRLSIDDVRTTSFNGAAVWGFINELAVRSTANVKPVVAYIKSDGGFGETVNRALPNPVHRLLALLFAHCDKYANRFLEYGRPWNPLEWCSDPVGDWPPLFTQLSSLLRLMNQAQIDGVDDDSSNPPSKCGSELQAVARIVRDACSENDTHPLAVAFGYHDDNKMADETRLSSQRPRAIARMLLILEDCGCVQNVSGRYVVVRTHLPARLSLRVERQELAKTLGFGTDNISKNLGDVIRSATTQDPAEFLEDLQTKPLPAFLRRLCADYMRTNWQELDPGDWPPCVADC